MDPTEDKYSYLDAGFDGFLSRSIDNVRQYNLGSQGPISTQIRYDSSQVTGAVGDVIRVGSILIDGVTGQILFYDGDVPVGLLGFSEDF